MNVYNQFIKITSLDNSAFKSIFMYLEDAVDKVQELELKELVISFHDATVSNIVYDLSPGNVIPKEIFSIIYLLFNKPDLINEEIDLLLVFNFKNKEHKLSFTKGQHFISDDNLMPLFLNNTYFNFMDGVNTETSALLNFERLFGFLIKKDLPTFTESNFEMQINKYLNNDLDITSENSSSNIIHKEVLIEKLVKKRNDLFKKVADLNKERLHLTNEKDAIEGYYKNKDQNELKYTSLGDDYKKLIEQEKAFYKNLTDIKSIINKIDLELASIDDYQTSLNIPEQEKLVLEEKRKFFLNKKESIKGSLVEGESNLQTISDMVQSTKMQLETLYSELDVINGIDLSKDGISHGEKISKINSIIEDLYLQISSLDSEILYLQKDIAQLTLSEDYKQVSSSIPNEVEKTSIVNSLNKNIIPNSINVVYKYLCNLYLFFMQSTSANRSSGTNPKIVVKDALQNMNITVNNFFVLNNNDPNMVDIV